MFIKEQLGEYKDDFSEIFFENESNVSKIYKAYNKKKERSCILKIIDKNELKKGDYDFHINRLKKEEEISRLCNSENTVNIYSKFETENHIIFEFELCDYNLNQYFLEEGKLETDKDFFKIVVQDIAKALMTLQKYGIIHRDIKPSNMFLIEIDGKRVVKLGDFGCAINKKDNQSDSIGTYLYNAPEVIKNLEYDDKCDLWSLGVSLFELYFGILPYAPTANSNVMLKYIYGDKEWNFKKTKDPRNPLKKPDEVKSPSDIIPNLDVLFRRLLTIDPEKRMTYQEFFIYVFNKDFMKPGIIAINNNPEYQKIYQIIENEKTVIYNENLEPENKNDEAIEKKNVSKIIDIIDHLPDIMTFANGSITGEQKYNNIIYYDENIDQFKSNVYKDSDIFENNTLGAFILCVSLDSLSLIRNEILKQIERDQTTSFNLITTGSTCHKVMKFIQEKEKFYNCIKHICVYCKNLKKWEDLKNIYNKIYGVFNKRKDVLHFINIFSSEEIKPFYITKLITLEYYLRKYNERHFKISQFYGNLNIDDYKKYIKEIEEIIKKEGNENKLFNKKQDFLLEGFCTFDLTKDLETLDNLIVKEYTKNTFYGDLNKWLMNSKFKFYEPVAYFTARLMYHLNSFALKKEFFFNQNEQELHRGIKLSFSSLLPYERAEGKIILLSAFTSTSEDKQVAERWAGRRNPLSLYKTNTKFSVVFRIKNKFENNWVSNGVNVQSLSKYKEKEILYQPFSFYKVLRVDIKYQKFIADIYLETIGKMEILEEKIKLNKRICYNKSKNIMEIIS